MIRYLSLARCDLEVWMARNLDMYIGSEDWSGLPSDGEPQF